MDGHQSESTVGNNTHSLASYRCIDGNGGRLILSSKLVNILVLKD